jgi:hypothetical protein
MSPRQGETAETSTLRLLYIASKITFSANYAIGKAIFFAKKVEKKVAQKLDILVDFFILIAM